MDIKKFRLFESFEEDKNLLEDYLIDVSDSYDTTITYSEMPPRYAINVSYKSPLLKSTTSVSNLESHIDFLSKIKTFLKRISSKLDIRSYTIHEMKLDFGLIIYMNKSHREVPFEIIGNDFIINSDILFSELENVKITSISTKEQSGYHQVIFDFKVMKRSPVGVQDESEMIEHTILNLLENEVPLSAYNIEVYSEFDEDDETITILINVPIGGHEDDGFDKVIIKK